MGRYSPSVPQVSLLGEIASRGNRVLDRFRANKDRKAQEEQQAKIDQREERRARMQDALLTANLQEQGIYEGTAPELPARPSLGGASVREDAPRPGLAAGATGPIGVGMQAGQEGGAGLGMQAIEGMSFSPRARAQPQIVHPAGSYVRGVGFTPVHLTDQDLEQRFRQINEGYYQDTTRTPTARAKTKADEVVTALEQMGADPGQLELVRADPGFADELYKSIMDSRKAKEPGTIRTDGRDFPDTEEGRADAERWRRQMSAAGRDGAGASGDDARVTGEVTRRTLALRAAQGLQAIDDELAGMTSYERQQLQPGALETRIRKVLERNGFTSVDELKAEMRTLRTSGVGGAVAPAGGAGELPPEISIEEIDALIQQNPDLSEEELLKLIGGG